MKLAPTRASGGILISPFKRGEVWHVIVRRGKEKIQVSTRETTSNGAHIFIKRLAERIVRGFEPFERSLGHGSLAAHVAAWLERQAKRLDPATMESYRGAARELVAQLGDKTPQEVTRADARELVSIQHIGAGGKPRSRKTLENRVAIWHAFFADWIDATRDETRVPRANPFDRASRLLEAGAPEPLRHLDDSDEGEPKPYSREQKGRLLAQARLVGGPIFSAVLLGLQAGLRNSEVLGLRICDVDFERGEIRVRQRISRGKIGPVKSARSRRDVPMTKTLELALRTLLLPRQEEFEPDPESAPIFAPVARPQGGGLVSAYGVMDVRTLRRQFGQLLEAAEIEPGEKPFHRLRHTFVSDLLIAGVELFWVSKWAGHSSPDFTSRVYSHWIPQQNARLVVGVLDGNEGRVGSAKHGR